MEQHKLTLVLSGSREEIWRTLEEVARRVNYQAYYYDSELERYLKDLKHLDRVEYSGTRKLNVNVYLDRTYKRNETIQVSENLTKEQITEEVNSKFGSLGWYTYDVESHHNNRQMVENEMETI